MAMVGAKNNLNMLAPQAAPASLVSSARSGAKPSPASSSSSSDFATLFSPKKSSAKDSPPPRPKTADDRADQPKSATANWPGNPKSEFESKAPSRLDGAPVGEPRGQLSRTERPVPDAQAKVEKREFDESVDNLAHRQALQGLLKKMKDEFGLDAEQVVQAFAALTPQELAQPPEASLEKLIQSLPLTPEQQGQAKLYFQQMLKETASTDMAGYLKSSQRQLSLEVVSRKEARDREIQRAVEQMQSDFFTQAQPVPQQQAPAPVAMGKYKAQQVGTPAQSQLKDAGAIPFVVNSMPGSGEAASPLTGGATLSEVASPLASQSGDLTESIHSSLKAAAPKPVPAVVVPQGEVGADMSPTSAGQTEIEKLPELFEADLNELLQSLDIPQAEVVSASGSAASLDAAAPMAPQIAAATSMSMGQDAGSSREDDRGSKDQGESWNPPVNQAAGRQGQATNIQKPEAFIAATQPTPLENAKNVKEVINRVQFLAGKGGGEMKVTMSPEGLGEVTMKVAIQRGQVNVEMITESKEVKKLLEQGLGDLKATLLANNLKVDQIRVDTPADVSRQLTQNHDEAQRQFAQQFMEQFRQNNNEWRRGFYDIPGAKNYPGQKEEAERGPAVKSSDRRRESSRRLDLVA